MNTIKERQKREETERPKNRISLNPISRLFENPQTSIEPYVSKGQVVADLGCNTGHYTFALADCVGSEGRAYAVDLKEEYIRTLEKKGAEHGDRNIEWHVASAADLSFINDDSVDFVLANGLLCNVAEDRPLVVNEINRILKPSGPAYLSLGAPPLLGFVGRAEWEKILERFTVKRKGGYLQKWAAVSKKDNGKHTLVDYIEPPKRPRFLTLRKKFGE
jgi:ubiquinone/menaquinone biosynthesis C-methylase UbiE